jgi:hypothetical protein
MYQPVGITAGASSFYVEPAPTLDPHIFDGDRMDPQVRSELLGMLGGFLSQRYAAVDDWLQVWLAGSGASYRWHAAQGLRDLDILLGIDFITFRLANRDYSSMGDKEIAKHINDEMRAGLWQKGWHDDYEVTFYVNANSQDIRSIKPYAAYDLLANTWTVTPSKEAPAVPLEYQQAAGMYHQRAQESVQRYTSALQELRNATNPAVRASAEARFNLAVNQAADMFDQIHDARRGAFGDSGDGIADWGNYVWQTGKQHGWLPALRQIKDFREDSRLSNEKQTYGVELPDQDVLLRRAALAYRAYS